MSALHPYGLQQYAFIAVLVIIIANFVFGALYMYSLGVFNEDMVINGLKEMDLIAYIRYAIVYLRLDDLGALRKEIDSLLKT